MGNGTSNGLPSRAERKKEREALRTAPADSGRGFDIKPSHVYYASYLIRDDQFAYNDGAKNLVDKLSSHEQLAGRGSGPDAFAASYAKVAKRFLEVWSKSVVSVGGAAVGLTATANNYVAADWTNNKKQYGPPPRKDPPAVINKAPDYGAVADLRWRGTNADSNSAIVRGIGNIPDFLADCVEEVIDKGLRLGKMYEVTPGAHSFEGELKDIAGYWKDAGKAALKAGDNFSGHIGTITNEKNNEWQDAMNTFCQSIWGTTAWGGTRNGQGYDWKTSKGVAPKDRQPILQVLSDTAEAMSKACNDLVDAATALTKVSEGAAIHAGKEMVKDMLKDWVTPSWDDFLKITPVTAAINVTAKAVTSFRSHMDYTGVNQAVDTYNETVSNIAKTLDGLMDALNEAYLSAPTYQAEEARAEGFGVRSLDDFKHRHPWTNAEDTKKGVYRIDLASHEWMDDAHSVDKHIGKTDAQLAQRLRDQGGPPTESWKHGKPSIGGASTFENMQKAQKLTQYNIDKNSGNIKKWLDGPPPPTNSDSPEAFKCEAPNGEYSGRSVTKQPNSENNSGFKNDGVNARAIPVKGVKTVLKYDDRLDPPFVVLTSMPDIATK